MISLRKPPSLRYKIRRLFLTTNPLLMVSIYLLASAFLPVKVAELILIFGVIQSFFYLRHSLSS